MREQPAGWYRDPVRPSQHRYWSGERWSDWLGEDLARARQEIRFEQQYDEREAG